jgi:pyruvate dehydrogenase E2 component (dihydrolipoamide acetyltransferase)
MANEIKMPQLSDTMSSGKILSWKKKEGDTVKRGDILAEVETDKANLEIECFQDGTLLKISTPAGEVAVVGEVIAVIGSAGESVVNQGNQVSNTVTQSPSSTAAPSPAQVAPVVSITSSANNSEDGRIKASPLARKIAHDKNIDLAVIQGSGPAGRIIRKDVDQASSSTHSSSAATASSTPPAISSPVISSSAKVASPASQSVSTPGAGNYVAFSKMRETIARRMVESVTQAPHFYVTTSVDMGEALKLREILKAKDEYQGISVNHMVIKAVGYGLAHEPRVNYAVKDGQIFEPAGINIGIITSVNDGLLIPVIRDVPSLSLKDVVFEARAAVDRARAGRPNASDLSGGTFSISNMGMFDVENFTAIINPGQGSILAVSSVKKVPLVRDNQLVIGSQMKVTVSVDHRIIDGIMASTFLKFFKEALETPALLIL